MGLNKEIGYCPYGVSSNADATGTISKNRRRTVEAHIASREKDLAHAEEMYEKIVEMFCEDRAKHEGHNVSVDSYMQEKIAESLFGENGYILSIQKSLYLYETELEEANECERLFELEKLKKEVANYRY